MYKFLTLALASLLLLSACNDSSEEPPTAEPSPTPPQTETPC